MYIKKLIAPLNEGEIKKHWIYTDRVYISSVCFTFNQKGYIRDTIDSFLAQETIYRFEIIIHDDASTDGTRDVLLEYKDIDSYFNNNDILLNSFVGPIAGRIEKGIIKLDDKQIELKTDDNDNYIHGMKEKWSDLLFDISAKSFDDFDILEGNFEQHNLELDSLFIITMNLKI
jgi:hypothetical protein